LKKFNELFLFAIAKVLKWGLAARHIGHGSPMNAIEENEFGVGFRKIGYEIQNRMPFYVSQRLGKPEAHM
jgi:hypothetical protein